MLKWLCVAHILSVLSSQYLLQNFLAAEMSRRGAINKAISGRHSVNGSASVRSESSPSLSSINVPLSLEDHAGAVGESPSPISAVASLGSAAESALPEMLDPQKIYKVRTFLSIIVVGVD